MLASGNLTSWALKEVVGLRETSGKGGSSCGTGSRGKVPLIAAHTSSITGKLVPPVLLTAFPTAPPISLVVGGVTTLSIATFAPPSIVSCGMLLLFLEWTEYSEY